ncbi:MAG: flagellar protein FlgN [Planctomycetota bacterium]
MTPPGTPSSPLGAPPAVAPDIDRLLDLLTRQRDLYQSLDALSGRQQATIADGHPEALLGILAERQAVVDRLTATNQDLAPLRPRMTQIADAAPAAQRTALRGLVDQVQSLLQTIIDRDDADRKTLETSKARVGQQLDQIKTAPRAINAYRAHAGRHASAPPAAAARFTDARG